MEHCKISKLLNDSSISKFGKKKDHSKRFMKLSIFCQQKYKVKTSMLRSDLCCKRDNNC